MSKTSARAKLIFQAILLFGALIAVVVSASQLSVVREFFGQASGEPANIQVFTKNVIGTYQKPWRNLAQGGESHNWRMEGQLATQVKTLKPEYIRIDHIYDFFDIVQGEEGSYAYDFSKLDLIVDDIVAVGAKPYIALSYMPAKLSKSDIVDAPKSYGEWQKLVQATVQHVSGTRRITDVYYEVWNEPDLFGSWKYYGGKNYLHLYSAAAKGAANTRNVQPFKIGGPAVTAFYPNWFEALMKHAHDNQLRLDFISWHRYDRDLDVFKKDMTNMQDIARKYPQFDGQLEFHITEWGHDSENDEGYDTNFSAAHTVAGAIEMVGVVERAFAFEIQDGKGPQEYWGRWGMFTHSDFGSKAKPRYFALTMLDKISDQRVQLLGKGSWVKALAAKNPDTNAVEVVLANYDAKSRNSENVPVTFFDIEPGTYTIIKELSGGGGLKRETVATTEAVLQTRLFMPANSVGFVTLQAAQ